MSEPKKLRTHCYYTDYVNHAIRFYLTCPDSLSTANKRKSDIDNWIAVQSVFHYLPPDNKQTIIDIYSTHHRIDTAVKLYASSHNITEYKLYVLLTKTWSAIAKRRGLI